MGSWRDSRPALSTFRSSALPLFHHDALPLRARHARVPRPRTIFFPQQLDIPPRPRVLFSWPSGAHWPAHHSNQQSCKPCPICLWTAPQQPHMDKHAFPYASGPTGGLAPLGGDPVSVCVGERIVHRALRSPCTKPGHLLTIFFSVATCLAVWDPPSGTESQTVAHHTCPRTRACRVPTPKHTTPTPGQQHERPLPKPAGQRALLKQQQHSERDGGSTPAPPKERAVRVAPPPPPLL